ncbi:hypothetical protein AVEN_216320-1 [Araneus ventricosus]|uniref:Uncharacterized protein n=1 Tax=Araneus ventricosus TaxID=182803 RepID=A0A4Y2PDE2_ARAVE|nr:hypothetical protein AVEN_216320-1 [Araneus ventricosus]
MRSYMKSDKIDCPTPQPKTTTRYQTKKTIQQMHLPETTYFQQNSLSGVSNRPIPNHIEYKILSDTGVPQRYNWVSDTFRKPKMLTTLYKIAFPRPR